MPPSQILAHTIVVKAEVRCGLEGISNWKCVERSKNGATTKSQPDDDVYAFRKVENKMTSNIAALQKQFQWNGLDLWKEKFSLSSKWTINLLKFLF